MNRWIMDVWWIFTNPNYIYSLFQIIRLCLRGTKKLTVNKTNQHLSPHCRLLVFSTLTAKKLSWMISLSHTCKGLESVHFKRLFADFGQIHFQLWANVILLQVFADLKYFICDALWSRSWRQSKGLVRNDVLIDTLWQIQMTRWPENRTVFLKCALFAHVKTEA